MSAVVRRALRGDLPEIVDIWVDAFSADPYFRWIAPEDEAYATFARRWMDLIASLCFERGHAFVDADGRVAVAWVPPDLTLVGPENVSHAYGLVAEAAGEARADEALAVILAARAHDLEAPHWTLQYLGVRAAARGSGLGAEVAAPGLAAVDHDRLPCALVSTNPRNLHFYERLGFSVIAEESSADGGVTLRPMVRPTAER